jgi:hypothetical protein
VIVLRTTIFLVAFPKENLYVGIVIANSLLSFENIVDFSILTPSEANTLFLSMIRTLRKINDKKIILFIST